MRRRSLSIGVLIAILGIAPACDQSSPFAPFLPPPVPLPPVPQPTASLAIEQTSLIVRPSAQGSGQRFEYEPRFQLRETSGKSGATIQNIFLENMNGGGSNTGPGCWEAVLRVPPGGTLDTFYSDEGWNWLGYCGVWEGGQSAAVTLRVVVSFTDDNGVAGTVTASVSAGT
jgi:hypothetical protein